MTPASKKYCETIEYRIATLEKSYAILDMKIDKLLENHIPHLSENIASLKSRMDMFTVVNVGSVITGIILLKFFN